MIIDSLELINFRNYRNFKVKFSSNINIIQGKNGQGKSNLLEAIYFLSIFKSQRASERKEMILSGEEEAIIRAEILKEMIKKQVEVQIKEQGKLILKENAIKKKIKEKTSFPMVLFTPDDLLIIKGTPKKRRDYLDSLICQIRPVYINTLINYYKVVFQRNALLKNCQKREWNKNFNDVWENKIIDLGSKIVKERRFFLNIVNPEVKQIYKKLVKEDEQTIDLEYKCEIQGESEEEIREGLEKSLNLKREEEKEKGKTLVGPHRDDFQVYINKKEAKKFASQGEERSAILALKLGEANILKKYKKEEPVILLDDVLSELDEERKQALWENLNEKKQVIITTTNENYIPINILKKAHRLYIYKGEVDNVLQNECSYKRDDLLLTT